MTEPTPAPTADPAIRLKRLLRNLVIAFVALLVAFVALQWWIGRAPSNAAPNPKVEAVASIEAAVKESPNDIMLRIKLADAYGSNGQTDEALAQLDAVLAVDAKNVSALMGKGVLLYRQGELDAAKGYLDQVVANSKQSEFSTADTQLSYTYYMLGQISSKDGDWKAAVGYFVNAVTIDSGDADSLYALGIAYNELGKSKYAIASFKNALAFVPTGWCEPYSGLKDAYDKLGNADGSTYAKSMQDVCNGGGLDAAAALNDLTKGEFALDAYIGLGLAAQNDMDNETALGFYEKAKALDPTNITANTAIATINAAKAPTASPES